MWKRNIVFLVLAFGSSVINAQENSIFGGGNGGGFSFQCHFQSNSNSIFGGGQGASQISDCFSEKGAVVDAQVLLAGPYDPGSGLMRDDLRQLGLLPLSEPYSVLGLTSGNGENVDPSVFSTTGPSAVVDWIIIELREVQDPAVIQRTRLALLLADGRLVDLDGSSLVQMKLESDSAFIAIRHRNHLGAMIDQPFDLAAMDTTVIDFIDPATIKYGTEPMVNVNGNDLLWSGNTNLSSASIKYIGSDNDRDPILVEIGGSSPTNTAQDYSLNDVNMDGTIKYIGSSNDRDLILINIGGSAPTNIRFEQLP